MRSPRRLRNCFSSLSLRKRIPLDTVKIDRPLAGNGAAAPDDAAIVATTLAVASRSA
jgi:EAL domain-containing protein (putative c-di-GMP-specific phosphodiesterase class I)